LGEGLRGCLEREYLWALSVGMFLAAQLAGTRGEDRLMAVLLSASETLRDSIGVILLPFARPWLDETVAKAKATLGRQDFDRAWRTGGSLALDTAIAMAIRETTDPGQRR
jgi:hypothetical protein